MSGLSWGLPEAPQRFKVLRDAQGMRGASCGLHDSLTPCPHTGGGDPDQIKIKWVSQAGHFVN